MPDNFLFIEKNGEEEIRLIDWEYAGMQDPHVDIAMFAVYAMYDREQVDALIDAYFPEGCKMRSGSRSTAISQHADFCGATGVSIKKSGCRVWRVFAAAVPICERVL